MRRFLSLLLFPVLVLPAWLILSPASLAAEAAPPDPGSAHHARQSWEQNFIKANVAHDGHLTLDEAKEGFVLVAKHFDDIDVDRKGYVTQNDVRAWRIMKKAARRLTKPPADMAKPYNAMQRASIGPTALTVQAMQTTAIPSPQTGVGADKD